MPTSTGTTEIVAEALGVLKERAGADGLIVDHDGTEAVRSILAEAIAQARREEDPKTFALRYRAEFGQTSRILAEKATDAARIDQTLYVGHVHIEGAVEFLRALKIWPFSKRPKKSPRG